MTSSRPRACSMTPPDDRVRIRHMRDAVEKALRYTQGSSRQGLEDDEILPSGWPSPSWSRSSVRPPSRSANRHATPTRRCPGRPRHACETDSHTTTSTSTSTCCGRRSPRTSRRCSTFCLMRHRVPRPIDERARVCPNCALTPANSMNDAGRQRTPDRAFAQVRAAFLDERGVRWTPSIALNRQVRGSSPSRRTHENRPVAAGSRRLTIIGACSVVLPRLVDESRCGDSKRPDRHLLTTSGHCLRRRPWRTASG
jgi:hypothetical protein